MTFSIAERVDLTTRNKFGTRFYLDYRIATKNTTMIIAIFSIPSLVASERAAARVFALLSFAHHLLSSQIKQWPMMP